MGIKLSKMLMDKKGDVTFIHSDYHCSNHARLEHRLIFFIGDILVTHLWKRG